MAVESMKVAQSKPLSRKKTQLAGKILIYTLLIGIGFMFGLPLLWLVSSSLKTIQQVNAYPPEWIPAPVQWTNFLEATTMIPFWQYFKNTAIITILAIVGTLLSCTIVAYGFARIEFPGRNFWFAVMISTMMLPGTITLIPRFIIFERMGWVDTMYPLIVPTFFGSAFFIFLIRQFFMGISYQLSDAARIDGCSELGILFRVVVPLAGPVLAVVAIMTFQQEWNDFMNPLIYLHSQEMKTLAVGLYDFVAFEGITQWQYLMAATLLMISPVLLLFAFFQKYFIQGITLSGGKD